MVQIVDLRHLGSEEGLPDFYPGETKSSVEETSTPAAFFRSLFSAMPRAAINLEKRVGLIPQNYSYDESVPEAMRAQKGDEAHPIASLLGSATGFAPLAIGTAGLTEGLVGSGLGSAAPWLSKLLSGANKVGRGFPAMIGHGAIQGGLYAPPGEAGEGAAEGAALSGLLHGLVKAPGGIKNIRRGLSNEELKGIDVELPAAEVDKDISEELIKAAKQKHGSPESLRTKIDVREEALKDLQENQRDVLPPEQLIPDLTHENELVSAENAHDESVAALDKSKAELENLLGKGQSHRVRAGKLVMDEVAARKEGFRRRYGELENNLDNVKVTMRDPAIYNQVKDMVVEIKDRGGLYDVPEHRAIEQILGRMDKPNVTVSGKELVNRYKATRDLLNETKSKAYQEGGIKNEDRQFFINKANELENSLKEQDSFLKESLGDKNYANLKKIDSDYANQISPLYQNKVYLASKYAKKAPANIIEATAGYGKEHALMQDIIQSNPELNRLVIGERYAGNPEAMLDLNEELLPYLKAHPELTKRLVGHSENIQSLEKARSDLVSKKEIAKTIRAEHSRTKSEVNAEVKKQNEIKEKIVSSQKSLLRLNERLQAVESEINRNVRNIDKFNELVSRRSRLLEEKNAASSQMKTLLKVALGYKLGHWVFGLF